MPGRVSHLQRERGELLPTRTVTLGTSFASLVCWHRVDALALRSVYGSPSVERAEAPEESEALSPVTDHLGMASF